MRCILDGLELPRLQEGPMLINRLALLLIISVLLVAGLCSKSTAQNKDKRNTEAKPELISPGVYDVTIILPKSLEPRRKEFRNDFISAETRLRAFAEKEGWAQLTESPFVKQVEIYDIKDEWDKRARQLDPTTPMEIPKSFSATIEKDILFSVSPEVYFANYPEGKKEPDAFVKLLTHELAHRLHIRILKGDEEKMGPMWFFEGFAVYAADQLNNNNKPNLSESQIWAIINEKERADYRKYNVVFRHFLTGVSLPEYVQKASEPKFMDWLKERLPRS